MFSIDSFDVQPLRFALQYSPPMLVVEYRAGPTPSAASSPLLHHHRIPVPASALRKGNSASLEAFLRKRHARFLRYQDRKQVRQLLDRLRSNLVEGGKEEEDAGSGRREVEIPAAEQNGSSSAGEVVPPLPAANSSGSDDIILQRPGKNAAAEKPPAADDCAALSGGSGSADEAHSKQSAPSSPEACGASLLKSDELGDDRVGEDYEDVVEEDIEYDEDFDDEPDIQEENADEDVLGAIASRSKTAAAGAGATADATSPIGAFAPFGDDVIPFDSPLSPEIETCWYADQVSSTASPGMRSPKAGSSKLGEKEKVGEENADTAEEEAGGKKKLLDIPKSVYNWYNVPASMDTELGMDKYRVDPCEDGVAACVQAYAVAYLLQGEREDPVAWGERCTADDEERLLCRATKLCLRQAAVHVEDSANKSPAIAFCVNSRYYRNYEESEFPTTAEELDLSTEKLVLSAILTCGEQLVGDTLKQNSTKATASAHSLTLRSGAAGTPLLMLLLTGFPSLFCFDGTRSAADAAAAASVSANSTATSKLHAIADGSSISGELIGVKKRALVGFLSLQVAGRRSGGNTDVKTREAIGDYLKNPSCPVWLLQLSTEKYAVLYRTDDFAQTSDEEASVASESGVELMYLPCYETLDVAASKSRKIFLRPNHLVEKASSKTTVGGEKDGTEEDVVNELLRIKWGDYAGIQWAEPEDD
mmetsp:Transcript_13753/g.33860  ORF Transcript_13753/g.33860 Transcript_13753/m.33860 type:complete len:704 (-) Transcript_13753:287-2398(-)|eukprot:CAMPEP_0179001004 /NCGR_PEP_ID=MMETSP0795-20121207/11053_1 /TAXON_ID=88552 /ORGANISM="Amoebophrya sp., Strain Ameob2" /LENGTH=703 /DNA_ID=CAMNT_0020694197 /DNA_START=192 /DNA_END=2303 /DNA_ORIENTATION=-